MKKSWIDKILEEVKELEMVTAIEQQIGYEGDFDLKRYVETDEEYEY